MHKSRLIFLSLLFYSLTVHQISMAGDSNDDFINLESLPRSSQSSDHGLISRYYRARIQEAEARADIMQNHVNRSNGTYWQRLRHPDTLFEISATLATAITPLLLKYLYTNYANPDQQIANEQIVKMNNINIEKAELSLEQEKLNLKQAKKKSKAEDVMIQLALQEKHTQVNALSILTALANKKAQGQELTEREQEADETLNRIFNAAPQRERNNKATKMASAAVA